MFKKIRKIFIHTGRLFILFDFNRTINLELYKNEINFFKTLVA